MDNVELIDSFSVYIMPYRLTLITLIVSAI